MAVKILIWFELGEGVEGPETAAPEYAAAGRGRLVDALRATGKPVEQPRAEPADAR